MMNRHLCGIFLLLLMMLSFACSTTKFVGDKEYLLDKVFIKPDTNNYKTTELSEYLRQRPNFKVFGLMKWQLYIYGWSGRNDKNWFNKQLRRLGEAPVILDTALVASSSDELRRYYYNKGFLNAQVTTEIDTSRRKRANVTYKIHTGRPYVISHYSMSLDDATMDSIANLKAPHQSKLAAAFHSSADEYMPLVGDHSLFDRDRLDSERQRITTLLRRNGYYAFNRDFLSYTADSSEGDHKIDIAMNLRPFRIQNPDGTYTNTQHKQYFIKTVSIVTDYNPMLLNGDTAAFIPTDTIRKNDLWILYGQNGHSIRPGVLRSSTYLAPGQMYNERNVELTYNSFAALKALKNVNIRFTEEQENDTMKLNAIVLTTPAKKQTVGVDLEGTNNAGDFGFASSLTYSHRNLFKGSETFTAKIRGAYESLSGSNTSTGLASYWEMGGETSISFPRFLFPFLSYDFRRKIRASSAVSLSYNQQTRPEYQRAILSGGWSYTWQDRSNTLARHTFKMLDVDYVHLPHIDEDFKKSLPISTLQYNYSDQFILGSSYTYSFNNFSTQNRQRNTHSLRASVELAGNILYGLSNLTGATKGPNDRYRLFGIDYAQFVKGDLDVSHGVILDSRNKLAFHVGFGLAYPYGNADRMPFERRYFSGGANSVRGWSIRELGPGSMHITDSTTFVQQAGDIRLDMNLEYRTKLFWKFELAAYVDGGNIWTIRPYAEQKNGNFDFSRFYKEIAFSYGLGLRLDFEYFLLRLDTGFKAYNPQETGSKRWAITNPNLKDNFALHFAVGYPF